MQGSSGHEHSAEELRAVHQDEFVRVHYFGPSRTLQCELDVREELIVDQLQQVCLKCTVRQWYVLAEHGFTQRHWNQNELIQVSV